MESSTRGYAANGKDGENSVDTVLGRRFRDAQVNIDQRPAVVTTRQRFGDWEGDTVQGKPGTGGIVTMVERKSRYLVAAKLEDKKAATLTEKCVKAFGPFLGRCAKP